MISKLPAIPDSAADVAAWVEHSVRGILERLKVPRLYALLLHRSQELLSSRGETLYRSLVVLKHQGKVEKIGVSIYGPEELDLIWPRYHLDLVQAPFNIIDRRMAASGWLARLHQAATEIHTRSAFLQGLLLMEAQDRPATLNRWESLWSQWHEWLREEALDPVQACLSFALSQPEIDRVVVGVDSLKQLQELLAVAADPELKSPPILACEELDLIDPSHWVRS